MLYFFLTDWFNAHSKERLPMDSLSELWEAVRNELKSKLSEVIYNVWINDIKMESFEGNTVVLSLTEFKRKIVEQKFMGVLGDAFEKVLGFEADIKLVEPQAAPARKPAPENGKTPQFSYTFDTFVVGSSNKFAHAAAQAVAANPGGTYNPLFVYGESGLGKTHLLRAVMNEVAASRPEMKCVFINGEDFTNELIHYIYAKKNMSEFHNKYRSADLLIVDDIQFIKGKEQTQEEFFHTFNAVTQEGHQIVLSSDKPPKEMSTLDERLRTRFEWGLLADIQPPDFETRMAIIKQKARDLEFDIPDDVVQYIAEKVKSNIRQLEGAVKRMKAIVTIQGAAKNITTAQSAIKDILTDSRPIPQTIEKIIAEVARTYGANPADIRSAKRDAPISQMRQIAMYVVSEVTGLTQEAIGREFSNRHHTTVIYALREIKDKIDRDPSLKATVNDIIKNVQQA